MKIKSTKAVRTEIFDVENLTLNFASVNSDVLIVESEDGRTQVQLYADSASAQEIATEAQIQVDGSIVTIGLDNKKVGFKRLLNFNSGGISVVVRAPRSSILNLKTVSADIETNVTALRLDVATVTGDVTIHQNPTTRCSVKTVSGDVIARTFSSCDYSLKSISGDLAVHVAPGLEIEVDGNSMTGDMNSEISLDGESDLTLKSAGVVVISASTVSGDFTLARN